MSRRKRSSKQSRPDPTDAPAPAPTSPVSRRNKLILTVASALLLVWLGLLLTLALSK